MLHFKCLNASLVFSMINVCTALSMITSWVSLKRLHAATITNLNHEKQMRQCLYFCGHVGWWYEFIFSICEPFLLEISYVGLTG